VYAAAGEPAAVPVSRLRDVPGIGVDRLGDAADAANDPDLLRLENLDTDVRPPEAALEATRRAVDDDAANSYLPFPGRAALREAAAAHVSRAAGVEYDWRRSCVVCAGGLNGILNVLLALLEPGDEVVLTDPVYVGLVNRVRVAGGAPRFARLVPGSGGWRLDVDSLRAAVTERTRIVLTVSPSMPTGCVLEPGEWKAVAALCREHDLWLVHDAAMDRILFDGRRPVHPASLPGMADRTITVGSASKELRMIGWRVGWVVGPPGAIHDVGLVGISNVVCQVGIAQDAVAAALATVDDGVAAATGEWEKRRDVVLRELAGLPVVRPHGGWSLLVDCAPLGLDGETASVRLFERGKVAATPMTGWGSADAARFVRFVYANEPAARLEGLGERVRRALVT
jgi:aspartate/methionine/tyrosine aminotransferase